MSDLLFSSVPPVYRLSATLHVVVFATFPHYWHGRLLNLEALHGIGQDAAVEVDILVVIQEEI